MKIHHAIYEKLNWFVITENDEIAWHLHAPNGHLCLSGIPWEVQWQMNVFCASLERAFVMDMT